MGADTVASLSVRQRLKSCPGNVPSRRDEGVASRAVKGMSGFGPIPFPFLRTAAVAVMVGLCLLLGWRYNVSFAW